MSTRAYVVAVLTIALPACSEYREKKKVAKGTLCVAATSEQDLQVPASVYDGDQGDLPAEQDRTVSYYQGATAELRVGDERFAIPNEQMTFSDLPEGTLVEIAVDGKARTGWRVDYAKHGKQLCYYFRPHKDVSQTAGWILDADREGDRCTCE